MAQVKAIKFGAIVGFSMLLNKGSRFYHNRKKFRWFFFCIFQIYALQNTVLMSSIFIGSFSNVARTCIAPKFLFFYHISTASSHPDNKVHGAIMGPTWGLSAPDGRHVGPMNLAIRADVAACMPNLGWANRAHGVDTFWDASIAYHTLSSW